MKKYLIAFIFLILAGTSSAGEYVGGIAGETINANQCACVDRTSGNNWFKSTNATKCPNYKCDGLAISDYIVNDDAIFIVGGIGSITSDATIPASPIPLILDWGTDYLKPNTATFVSGPRALVAMAYNTTSATTDPVQAWIHPPMAKGPCCIEIAPNLIIAPTISADQTSYNPSGIEVSDGFDLVASNGSFWTIDGMKTGYDGRAFALHNAGSFTFLLKHHQTLTPDGFDFGGYDVPLFPAEQIQFRHNGTNWVILGTVPIIPPARWGYYFRDDGVDNNTGFPTITFNATGTAAAWANLAASSTPGFGIQQGTTGTTATGDVRVWSRNQNGFRLGNNIYWRYETRMLLEQLSTGTQTFTWRGGFIDNNAADSVDGVYFRYTDGVNAGKWQLVCRSNSVETATNSSTAPAALVWYRLTIIVNPAGTSAEFFVNGASIGTCASNIPTANGRETGFGNDMVKSVGTTATNFEYDYMEMIGYWNTAS